MAFILAKKRPHVKPIPRCGRYYIKRKNGVRITTQFVAASPESAADIPLQNSRGLTKRSFGLQTVQAPSNVNRCCSSSSISSDDETVFATSSRTSSR